MEFDNIYLTQEEKGIFESVMYGAIVTLHTVDAEHLLKAGLIAPYALSKTGNQYVVTLKGARYRQYLFDKEAQEKQAVQAQIEAERIEKKHFWVSVIVSNLIAFAALIVSILK